MKKHKSVIITISLNDKLSNRMNKFVMYPSNQDTRLSVSITPFHHDIYKSIERGNRSYVFSMLINQYLDILEKENIGKIFQSKSELIRNVLTQTQLLKKRGNKMIWKKTPSINSPLGNIYHMEGDWRKYHNENKILKYDIQKLSDSL